MIMRSAAVMALTLALAPSLEAAWEAQSAQFRVTALVSSAPPASAIEFLETFRLLALEAGLGPPNHRSAPIEALLLNSVDELAPFAPDAHSGRSRGVSIQGTERHFIAVVWDAPGSPLTALAHEYAHLLDPDQSGPAWFREGLAEYLSRLEKTPTGSFRSAAAWGHIESLRRHPWLPFEQMFGANRRSPTFAHPTFYAQSWLTVHWLASHSGSIRELAAERGRRALSLDPTALETELRTYAASFKAAFGAIEQVAPRVAPTMAAQPIPDWLFELRLTDFHREQQHWDEARPRLENLFSSHSSQPGPAESLGALLMDRGEYDEAERLLSIAVSNGSTNARTHYRYALMLMRPVVAAWSSRPADAIQHAKRAGDLDPQEPLYLLTEAQARMNAGHWAQATECLSRLSALPDWRERADEEYSELQRRRTQTLTSSRPPRLEAPVAGRIDPLSSGLPALELDLPAAPPASKQEIVWPPPRTILLYGRVAAVECRDGQRIVTVHTPRNRVRLREPAEAPARLYSAPSNWKHLPCGSRGWEVNVAYRPAKAGKGFDGVLVAVVF